MAASSSSSASFTGFISMLQLNPYFPNHPHPIAVCRGVRLFVDPDTIRAFFVSSGKHALASWLAPITWDDSLAVIPPLALLLAKEKKKADQQKSQWRAEDQESSWFAFRHAEWGVQYFVSAISGEAQWYPPSSIRNQVIEGPGAVVCWEPGVLRLSMNKTVSDGDDILSKIAVTRVFPQGSPTPAARRESLGDTSDLVVKANLAALESSGPHRDTDDTNEEVASSFLALAMLPKTIAIVNGWKICQGINDVRLYYQRLLTGESQFKVPHDILTTPVSEWRLGSLADIGGRAMSRSEHHLSESHFAHRENGEGQTIQSKNTLDNSVPIVHGASLSQFEGGQAGIREWLTSATSHSPLAPTMIPHEETIVYNYQNGLGLGLGLLPGRAGVVRTRRYSSEMSSTLPNSSLPLSHIDPGEEEYSSKGGKEATKITSNLIIEGCDHHQDSVFVPSSHKVDMPPDKVKSASQRYASVMKKIKEQAASRIPKKPTLSAAETFLLERDADRLWRNAEVARMRQKTIQAQGRAKESIAEARKILAEKTREEMVLRMHEVWKEEEDRQREVRMRIETKRRSSLDTAVTRQDEVTGKGEKNRRSSLGRAGSVISTNL
jgi:hypothetical protein